MNKDIFEQVAEAFVEYCADYYDSGFEDTPEGYDTPEGFRNCFKDWLEKQDGDGYQHVLDHFDEVGVENINEGIEDDEPMFIPVIEDNSPQYYTTAQYMDGQ